MNGSAATIGYPTIRLDLKAIAALEPVGLLAAPWYGAKTAAGHPADRRRVRDDWGTRPNSTPTRRAIMRELVAGSTVIL